MSTTTPIDVQRIRIKAILGEGVMGERPITTQFYLDAIGETSSSAICTNVSGPYSRQENFTENALLRLATGLFCNGFCGQNGAFYEWQVPQTCDDNSWRAKEITTVVIPPLPTVTLPITPQPTPTPAGPPTGSSQSIADLPIVDDPNVTKQRESALNHINQAKNKAEELKKKAEKNKLIRNAFLQFAASAVPGLVSSAVSRAVGGSNANTVGSLAGAFSNLALQSVAARASASRAQSASLAEAVSFAINDQNVANQIDTNIQTTSQQTSISGSVAQLDFLNGDIFAQINNTTTASSGSAQRG